MLEGILALIETTVVAESGDCFARMGTWELEIEIAYVASKNQRKQAAADVAAYTAAAASFLLQIGLHKLAAVSQQHDFEGGSVHETVAGAFDVAVGYGLDMSEQVVVSSDWKRQNHPVH